MTHVLVAFASKYGSVGEVARFVGGVLEEDDGFTCDVRTAADVTDLDGYDLVVLGAGLYMGRLHRDARRFLRHNHEPLESLPFAVFAMGPLANDDAEKEKVRPQLEKGLAKFPELAPVATVIFGGVVDPEKLSFPFNRMPAGDHRDWDEIREFASSLPTLVPIAA